MAVSAAVDFKMQVTETLASLGDMVSGSVSGLHKITETTSFTIDATDTLTADHVAGTPTITEVWSDEFTLTTGAATLDLTALARDNQSTLDLSGKKIQAFFIAVPSTNAGAVTISDGATNGYNLFGDASGQVTIGNATDRGFVMMFQPEVLPDVANGSADQIDFAGTGTDTVKILLVAG